MYLNIYDFGYNVDGVRSAAKIFFDTNPENLTIEQSATLLGMLQNSSLYNPIRRPELVTKRRNVVFQQMYRNKLLTKGEKDSRVSYYSHHNLLTPWFLHNPSYP